MVCACLASTQFDCDCCCSPNNAISKSDTKKKRFPGSLLTINCKSVRRGSSLFSPSFSTSTIVDAVLNRCPIKKVYCFSSLLIVYIENSLLLPFQHNFLKVLLKLGTCLMNFNKQSLTDTAKSDISFIIFLLEKCQYMS